MSLKIRQLIDEKLGQVKLEQELAIASTVQQNLIPPESFQNDRIEIQSYYQSASQTGGDWWGLFEAKNRVYLMIADATGHGLPCALITASARSCFSFLNKLAEEDENFSLTPQNMLSFANRIVFEASRGQIMMTAFLAVINFEDMTLTYSSAGHNPPWHFRQAENKVVTKSLVGTGTRLGESKNFPEQEATTMKIEINDTIVLYTDGLTENTNPNGIQYGKKNARKKIEATAFGGAKSIIKEVIADFHKHNDSKPLDDDVTVAVIRILS
jgi:sigma-B regulation protein RsbU (phosphoserine phosphatase)